LKQIDERALHTGKHDGRERSAIAQAGFNAIVPSPNRLGMQHPSENWQLHALHPPAITHINAHGSTRLPVPDAMGVPVTVP